MHLEWEISTSPKQFMNELKFLEVVLFFTKTALKKLKKHSTKTALSKYIWELKGSNTNYTIQWSIVRRASSNSGASTSCNLCPAEKMCILNADKRLLLNKKSELISKCRHQNKFYVKNTKILPN